MVVVIEEMKTDNNLSSKQNLRKSMLSKLSMLKEVDRAKKSLLVKEKLFECLEYKGAKTILFYASLKNEVETDMMIKEARVQGKNIGLPVILEKENRIMPFMAPDFDKHLKIGTYGIREPEREFAKPMSLEEINLIIVPGLAFDLEGNRLGRGRGYYDRLLQALPEQAPTIGIAFDFQIVEDLPHSSKDSPVNKVIFS